MKKSPVYTRTGDEGRTSLVNGARISKSDQRIDLFGDVDELNSQLGLVIAHLAELEEDFDDTIACLTAVQSALFNLGSKLACEEENWETCKLVDIDDSLAARLEATIDQLDSEVARINHFILPGGSRAASFMHVARTICRRVERKLVEFSEAGNTPPPHSLQLLNRLSDFLFVAARQVNCRLGVDELPWKG